MAFPLIPILSEGVGLVQSWIKGKQQKQAARDEREAELIRQQGSWEEIMAQGAATSWKDEMWSIIFAIPLTLSFIPGLAPWIANGFAVIDQTPEWYKWMVAASVAASFGIRSVANLFNKKNG